MSSRRKPGSTFPPFGRRTVGPGFRRDDIKAMIGLGNWGRRALIGLPFLGLAVFFLLPLAIVAAISLAESADAIPPFTPLLSRTPSGLESHATLSNYRELAESCLRVYAN